MYRMLSGERSRKNSHLHRKGKNHGGTTAGGRGALHLPGGDALDFPFDAGLGFAPVEAFCSNTGIFVGGSFYPLKGYIVQVAINVGI